VLLLAVVVSGIAGPTPGTTYDSLSDDQKQNARTIIGGTQAAQAAQRSAYPDAYAKWETLARDIVAHESGASTIP
jgi:hypothetical protein